MRHVSIADPQRSGLDERYTGLAIALHWITAGLVVALVAIGFPLSWAPFPSETYDTLHYWHRSLGELTLFVVAVSLIWRWRSLPPWHVGIPAWQARAARVTRWAIYALLIVLALSKIVRDAFGLGFVFFGLSAGPLFPANKFAGWLLGRIHYFAAILLLGFVALHVCGALWHGLVRRDHILFRMLPRHLARGRQSTRAPE
jgi:cytochrome b561